jgi:steroid 5-alpha reductase family enzyme
MNPVSVETFMIVLILAYVFMSGIFIISQRQGQTFIASFDKAIVWGSGFFVIGSCLDTIAYVTWA